MSQSQCKINELLNRMILKFSNMKCNPGWLSPTRSELLTVQVSTIPSLVLVHWHFSCKIRSLKAATELQVILEKYMVTYISFLTNKYKTQKKRKSYEHVHLLIKEIILEIANSPSQQPLSSLHELQNTCLCKEIRRKLFLSYHYYLNSFW